MSDIRQAAPPDSGDAPDNRSDMFRIPLECPECGTTGSVDWKSLKNGMGCPACGCRFLIGRNGQVQSEAELPHMRYSCPRCRHSGAIPTIIAARSAECPGCHLPLVPGPDQRLHGAKEAAELWRLAGDVPSHDGAVDWLTKKCIAPNGRVRKPFVAMCATALMGLAVGATLLVQSLFDNSPETHARQFVRTCLSGNWDDALEYLEDNAVQRTEFQRWRTQYFSSILDTYRPNGDRVDVDVRVLKATDDTRIMLVSMNSPFIGTRSNVQHWRELDGRWLFDAHTTLVQQGSVRKSRWPPSKLNRAS